MGERNEKVKLYFILYLEYDKTGNQINLFTKRNPWCIRSSNIPLLLEDQETEHYVELIQGFPQIS